MFWNWKELVSTFSFDEQAHVRTVLAEQSIRYKIKTLNRTSPNGFSPARRAYTGAVGEAASMYEYVFYVKPKDYELAAHLISK